jgi:hypothetical protein
MAIDLPGGQPRDCACGGGPAGGLGAATGGGGAGGLGAAATGGGGAGRGEHCARAPCRGSGPARRRQNPLRERSRSFAQGSRSASINASAAGTKRSAFGISGKPMKLSITVGYSSTFSAILRRAQYFVSATLFQRYNVMKVLVFSLHQKILEIMAE